MSWQVFRLACLIVVFGQVAVVAAAAEREQSVIESIANLRNQKEKEAGLRLDELHLRHSNAADFREKRILALALGVHYIEDNRRLAMQYLAQAEVLTQTSEPLFQVTRYYKGMAQFRSGSYLAAATTLRDVVKNVKSLGWERLSYDLLIDSLAKTEKFNELLEAYNQYTKKFAASRRQQDVVKLAAIALEKKGELHKVYGVLEELASAYPMGETSRWAFRRLVELSCPFPKNRKPYIFPRDFLLRLARNGTLETGIREFVIGLIDLPLGISGREVRRLDVPEKIEFLLRARFYNDALPLAQGLADGPSGSAEADRLRARGLLLLGRTYAALNQHDLAVRQYSTFVERFPNLLIAYRVRELLADSLSRLGLHKEAAQEYALSATATRSSDEILRWSHFWNTYLAGAYADALELLNRPGYVPPRDRSEASGLDYWRGRILEKMGRGEEAEAIFHRILDKDAGGYYAVLILARNKSLGERAAVDPMPQAVEDSLVAPEPPQMGMAAKILRLEPKAAHELLTPDLKLVDDLMGVGLFEAARTQLRGVSWQDYRGDESFAVVSRFAWLLNDYRPSLRAASRPNSALRSKPQGWAELLEHQQRFRDDWKVFYPMAYEGIVTRFAKEVAISPFFVLSIMRAESHYNSDARSPVGAQGLMQLMPYTATRIARILGDSTFEIASLKEPEVNIAYGAYYLKRLLTYYDSNPILAIAAYNAGPVMVNTWVGSERNREADEFAESIPFRETRRYVKAVLRNFNFYTRIYQQNNVLTKLPLVPENLPEGQEVF